MLANKFLLQNQIKLPFALETFLFYTTINRSERKSITSILPNAKSTMGPGALLQ